MNTQFDIDAVITFVDNTDPVWQVAVDKKFQDEYNSGHLSKFVWQTTSNMFENNDELEICLFGIRKFMPWVRDIYLVVSNLEQIPEYAKQYNIKIVLHEDIIPPQFLPQFNSSVIELFLHKIPGLAEHFLYFNDDCFVIQPIEKNYFFTDDGIPINGFRFLKNIDKLKTLSYGCAFLNSDHAAREITQYKQYPLDALAPWHDVKALTISNCEECWHKLHDTLTSSITPFRSEKNINGYVFQLYDLMTDKCKARNEDFNQSFHLDSNYITDYSQPIHNINNDNQTNFKKLLENVRVAIGMRGDFVGQCVCCPPISIIIPVCNASNYVHKMFTNIQQLAAAIPNAEFLVVANGCTDDTEIQVDEFISNNNHICVKLIHVDQKGVSHARNVGIKNATGKFIWFIDCDDAVHAENVRVLLQIALQPKYCNINVFLGQIQKFVEQKNKSWKIQRPWTKYQTMHPVAIDAEIIKHQAHNDIYYNVNATSVNASKALFRRKYIIDKQFQFDENMFVGEDWIFLATICTTQQKLYISSIWIYDYCQICWSKWKEKYKKYPSENKVNSKKQVQHYIMKQQKKANGKTNAICYATQFEEKDWQLCKQSIKSVKHFHPDIHIEILSLGKPTKTQTEEAEMLEAKIINVQNLFNKIFPCFNSNFFNCFSNYNFQKIAFAKFLIPYIESLQQYHTVLYLDNNTIACQNLDGLLQTYMQDVLQCCSDGQNRGNQEIRKRYNDIHKYDLWKLNNKYYANTGVMLFDMCFPISDYDKFIKRTNALQKRYFAETCKFMNDQDIVCLCNNTPPTSKTLVANQKFSQLKTYTCIWHYCGLEDKSNCNNILVDTLNKLGFQSSFIDIDQTKQDETCTQCLSIKPKLRLLLVDAADKAGDNAEYLYRQIKQLYPNEIYVKFAISPYCKDYNRLVADGFDIIPIYGNTTYDIFKDFDFILFSKNFSGKIMSQMRKNGNKYRHKIVFLQHGTTSEINAVSTYIYKLSKIAKYICVAAKHEVDLVKNWTHNNINILQTGFPRHDFLFNKLKKQQTETKKILIAFHWNAFRSNASNAYISDINTFLNSSKLEKLAENGVEVQLMLHPFIITCLFGKIKQLSIPKYVKPIKQYDTIQDILVSSSVIISDFSSNLFEFGYTGKPCLAYVPALNSIKTTCENYHPEKYGLYPFITYCPTQNELFSKLNDILQNNNTAQSKHTENMLINGQDTNSSKRLIEWMLAQQKA